MVHAHLAWSAEHVPGAERALPDRLSAESRALISAGVLATDWFPFRCLVDLDRAIADLAGGDPDQVFRSLGRHSAALNLKGAYRAFVADDPHRVFERTALLHERFQNFGRSSYERREARAGRIRVEGCEEYSPVFCASALGFYEGALLALDAPGGRCVETRCMCLGDDVCVFEMEWA
jgi:predicted hydrocarbon binding protein